jgi:hypothetical protein
MVFVGLFVLFELRKEGSYAGQLGRRKSSVVRRGILRRDVAQRRPGLKQSKKVGREFVRHLE